MASPSVPLNKEREARHFSIISICSNVSLFIQHFKFVAILSSSRLTAFPANKK